MTVAEKSPRVIYDGNGSTTVFSFDFQVEDDDGLEVYIIDSGVKTLQTKDTDYTVSLNPGNNGGDVTYPISGSALATGLKILIMRVESLDQSTDLSNVGAYFLDPLESMVDKSRRIDQDESDALDRSIKVDEGYSGTIDTQVVPAAGRAIGFDATGAKMATYAATAVIDPAWDSIQNHGNSLNQMVSDIGSGHATVLIDTTPTINAGALTIPSNILLVWLEGASVLLATSNNLTLNCSIIAGKYEILSGSGTVSGTPLVDQIFSEWFAAGVTDSTSGLIISSFAKTILDDADASAALTTLGVSTFIKTLLDDADAVAARTTINAANKDIETYRGQLARGYLERPQFTYNGGTAAYTVLVGAGAYMCKDKYCYWSNQLTSNAIGSPIADTWYYLYLDYSAIASGIPVTASELIWSTTAPTWNNTYRQWMNGDDRCIFAVRANSTPDNILEFFQDGDLVTYADDIEDLPATDIDTTWVTVTLTAPGMCRKISTTFYSYAAGDTSAAMLFWRTYGQTGTDGHHVGSTDSNNANRSTNTIPVIADDSQRIQIVHSLTGLHSAIIYTAGWYFPDGM